MLAAVLVIKELAESAPAVMSARVADACRLLWLPLSQSESAREHAAEALGSCLRLASQRPATMSGWVDELLECAKAALSPGAATPLAGPAAHGALLLLSCLLRVASADGVFDAAYEAAAATVGAVLPNRRAPPEVHRAALKLLPAMAAARPSKILHDEEKLAEALRHIELSVREPRYRPDAYVAKAALLRLLDAAAIRQQLPLLVPSIKEAMLKARTSRVFVVEALPALGLLAAAVGEDLFLHNEQMLSALLTLPLSPELAAAFTLISRAIPSLSVRVQERQLELISLHLAHMPFRQACEHAPPTIAAALHRQPPPLQLPPPSQRHGLEQWPRPGGAAAAAAAAAAGPSAPTLADGSSTRDGIAAAAEVGPPGAPGGTLVTGGAGGGAKHAASCPNLVRAASAGCAPMAAPSPGSGCSSPESPTEGDASVRRGRLFHSGGVGGAPAWGAAPGGVRTLAAPGLRKLGSFNALLDSLLKRKTERSPLGVSAVGGAPSSGGKLGGSGSPHGADSAWNSQQNADEARMLALRTLAASPPQPPGEVLPLRFALYHIVPHFYSAAPPLRCQGALACVAMLKPAPEPAALGRRSAQAAAATRELLNHLLALAVGDPEPATRVSVLKGLQSIGHLEDLAEAMRLRSLGLALHDEQLQVQLVALPLVGQLCEINPAVGVPMLRGLLLTLCSQLDPPGGGSDPHRSHTRRRHEAVAKLLRLLARHASRLMRTYAQPVLSSLLAQLRATLHASTATELLLTIAELLRTTGRLVDLHLLELLDVLIHLLQRSGAPLRARAALTALERLLSCVNPQALGVSPYVRFPSLLPTLLLALASEQHEGTRCSLVRVLGMLGALEPLRYRTVISKGGGLVTRRGGKALNEENGTAGARAAGKSDAAARGAAMQEEAEPKDERTELGAGSTALDRGGGQSAVEARWPAEGLPPCSALHSAAVALRELLAILQDTALAAYHHRLIAALFYIFSSLGQQCSRFLPRVMPQLLAILLEGSSSSGASALEAPSAVASLPRNLSKNALIASSPSLVAPRSPSMKPPSPRLPPRTAPQVCNHLLQQLPALVSSMRCHLQPWLPQLVQIILMHWQGPLLLQVLALLEQIALVMRHALLPYEPQLVPLLAGVIANDGSSQRVPALTALAALEGFGPVLRDYSSLLLPPMLQLVQQAQPGSRAQHQALHSLQKLSCWLPLPRIATSLTPTLLHILCTHPEAKEPTMRLLRTLMCQMGRSWRVLEHKVARVLGELNMRDAEYERLLPHALSGQQVELLNVLRDEARLLHTPPMPAMPRPNRLVMKQAGLAELLKPQQRSSKDEWLEWMGRLAIELLRDSPSPALRACAPVAQMHMPLGRRLFQVAFISCWAELGAEARESFVLSLEYALHAPSTPEEILQELLALAEYMERHDFPLPISARTLGDIASSCAAFSKALHYREVYFHSLNNTQRPSGNAKLVDALLPLVSIHNSLKQPEAALGVLHLAQYRHGLQVKLSWLEKLGRWQDALQIYERSHLTEPRSGEFVLGRLRCLAALSEWPQLSRVSEQIWGIISAKQQVEAAPLVATARWHCQQWPQMADSTKLIAPTTYEGSFYRAVLSIHAERFEEAQRWVDSARTALHPQLRSLASESYDRAHASLVQAQQLAETEELIEYKCCQRLLPHSGGGASEAALHAAERCAAIRLRWRERLRSCSTDMNVWQNMIELRSMVLEPLEQMEAWIKFASLCRNGGRLELCRASLSKLLPHNCAEKALPVHQLAAVSLDGLGGCEPELLYAYAKYLWVCGAQSAATRLLQRLLHSYGAPVLLDTQPFKLSSRRSKATSSPNVFGSRDAAGGFGSRDGGPEPSRRRSSPTGDPAGIMEPSAAPLCRPIPTAGGHAGLAPTAVGAAAALVEIVEPPLPRGGGAPSPASNESEPDDLRVNDARGHPDARAHSGDASLGDVSLEHDPLSWAEMPISWQQCRSGGCKLEARLAMRCFLKLGHWQLEQQKEQGSLLDEHTIARALHSYSNAFRYGASSTKAWHSWALMNVMALDHLTEGNGHDSSVGLGESLSLGGSPHGAEADPAARSRPANPSPLRASPLCHKEEADEAGGVPTAVEHRLPVPMSAGGISSGLGVSGGAMGGGGGGGGGGGPGGLANGLTPFDGWSASREERLLHHAVSALKGFFRSITLSRDSEHSLQDLLRLLTLWFRYGGEASVDAALVEGFELVDVDTWLLVIPQIIARISSPKLRVRKSVHALLLRVCDRHPQALIYPLAVASHEARNRSDGSTAPSSRGRWAERILQEMREKNDTLVEQALLVSNELIRVAILWAEQWHEALEQAYRRYFYHEQHGIEATMEVLRALYKKMEEGAVTANELAFVSAHGADLQTALTHCREFMRTGHEPKLQCAWEHFYTVLRQLGRALQEARTLQLHQVSPALLEARELELAVPGTYRAEREVVAIRSFAPAIQVMNSKQRPRKLAVLGSDGVEYVFLLKGHEDLRQDERVMQLFGLVNTLLASTPSCARHDLGIQRYSVVPLSTNSGLIEWVPQCDTLHTLVRDSRLSRSVLLNIEHQLMLHFAPDLASLGVLQKIEAFQQALSNTDGMDLYRVLWMKAPSSEVWLERRSNFSHSLAVMSMVGHILGLGDRHPSNLMLHRFSGKIAHIDFGDCFEVAMRRDKFPETVPFRLTRMLVNAMEVSAVEGTFRSTCERVMTVLREHKDSVMAMLEAFIHDPLIKWRLLHSQYGAPTTSSTSPSALRQGSASLSGAELSASVSLRPSLDLSLRASLEESFGYAVDPLKVSMGAAPTPMHSLRQKQWATKQGEQLEQLAEADGTHEPHALNERAVSVIRRVDNKLTGREFGEELTVSQQVQCLIEQATSHQNLCQAYIGWCPFW